MTAQFEYQGFDVFSNYSNALTSASATAAYQGIAATGANSIGISPKLFLQTGTSSQLVTDPTKSTADASLIAGIKAAEAQGLKVLLEPHIGGLDGTVSSSLAPSDTAAFFTSYKAAIVHLASIAQQTGVDTFSIGDEMSTLTGAAYRSQWLDVIAAVRQVYSGKITYEAATNEASSVSFWDKVDTIGFNAYLPLSASADPTVANLEKAWTTAPADNYWSSVLHGQSVVAFLQSLSNTYGKQVLITEVGYRSIAGTTISPGSYNTVGTTDLAAQTNAYQALFQVLSADGGSWMAGIELLEYNIDQTNNNTDYSVQGKPAMALVQQYFKGTGVVTGQTITGSAVSDLIDVGAGDDTINAGLGNDIIKVGSGNDIINAGPAQITTLKTTTVTITGYGAGGQVALLINGHQVGGTVTFTPAADTSGYQTYTFTFTNPDQIKSLDIALLNASNGANAMIRGITINGASLATSDVTNASAPGTFNLYNQPLHLDATNHQDWFYGAQSDDDLIYVGTGNDTIDGGAGIDTVVFQGKAANYTLARSGTTLIVSNGTVSDKLTNVEYLQFSDATFAVASLVIADVGSSSATSLMSPLLSQAVVSGAAGTTVAHAAVARVASAPVAAAPQITVNGVSVAGASVSLLNGSTVLATTTASATGAYSFTIGSAAAGVYALTTQAQLGTLSSAASNAAVLVVGSSQTVAALIMAAPTTPSAIYVTDPNNPIVVSTAQLQAIAPALMHDVTGATLAVVDTAAAVVASLDLLGTVTGLQSITLSDTNVFAVSASTMKQMIATDASVLATIQGGYSFSVSAATSSATVATTFYDATGTVTGTRTVTTLNGITETYLHNADGSTSDTFVNAAGIKTSQSVTTAAGKTYTIWGIVGKPYASQTYVYDASNKLVSLTGTAANGQVVSVQTIAGNGAVTLDSYSAGVRTQRVITNPDGSSDTQTFNAAGTLVTDAIRNADGTRDQYDYGITGKPYVSDHIKLSSTGVGLQLTRYTASGAIYSDQTTASNGTVTLDSYINGVRTQRLITNTDGSTDTQTFNANGTLVTDYQRHADGTRDQYDYAITGQAYASDHMTISSAGVVTELTKYLANGGLYTDQTTAATGTVTLDSYTAGVRTQRFITNTDGSTDTQTFNANGTLVTDYQRHANGTRDQYDYAITGQAYASDHMTISSAGVVTELTKYLANGSLYSDQTTAATGTVTLDSYTAGVRTQRYITNTDGSTDTHTFNAAGTEVMDYQRHANGTRDQYDYGITGQPYTSDHITSTSTGVVTEVQKFLASGALYSDQTIVAGTTTTDSYTKGVRTQRLITSPDGSTDTHTFNAAGTEVMDYQRHANGTRDQYDYGITGQPYTSDHVIYNSAGTATEVLKYVASGALLSDQTTAANGTVTTTSYTNGVKTQSLTVNTDGSTDTQTFNTAGTLIEDYQRHADNSRDQYDYAITGKSYTSDHLIYNTSGVGTDVIKYNTDGTTTNTAYAANVTLTGTTGNDTFTSFGGDTFTFAGQTGNDTINNFKVANDVIAISKSMVSNFANLPLTQSGGNAKIVFDAHNSVTLTGINSATLTSHNFTFV